jgi:DNA polymerase-3 subunit epsilon
MPYLVFDTETTGLPDWQAPADAASQPRLASFCLLFVDDDLEIESRVSGLVKPDGWEIPATSTAINGLTQARLEEEGWDVTVPLHVLRLGIDAGRTLVAHNLQFDTKIMRGELRRAQMPDQGCLGGICTMRLLTDVCGIPHPKRSGYKFPRLEEACRVVLKREMKGAHDALNDAKACLWLLRAMRERGMLTTQEAA